MHNLEVRQDYQSTPVESWTRNELIAWLIDEGFYQCGMDTCFDSELLEEIVLQAEMIDWPLIRVGHKEQTMKELIEGLTNGPKEQVEFEQATRAVAALVAMHAMLTSTSERVMGAGPDAGSSLLAGVAKAAVVAGDALIDELKK